MARIRTVKPEFFVHEGIHDLEKKTGLPLRLAFIGLWCQADKEGRFKWRPRPLKHDIMPYDEVDFSAILEALAAGNFVARYEVNGKLYGYIPSWHEHQKPHHKEFASELPSPEFVHSSSMNDKTQNAVQVKPCFELQPSKEEEIGIRDRKKEEERSSIHQPTIPLKEFEDTPEGLAQLWCFHLKRRKFGAPADNELDKAEEFRELVRLGQVQGDPSLSPEKLREAVLDPKRDRSEHFWQFKDRLTKAKEKAKPLTMAERLAQKRKERECTTTTAEIGTTDGQPVMLRYSG